MPGGSRDVARASRSIKAAVARDMRDPRRRWLRLKQLKSNIRSGLDKGGQVWYATQGNENGRGAGAGAHANPIDLPFVFRWKTLIENRHGPCPHGLPCHGCPPYSIAAGGAEQAPNALCETRTQSSGGD